LNTSSIVEPEGSKAECIPCLDWVYPVSDYIYHCALIGNAIADSTQSYDAGATESKEYRGASEYM